VKSRCLPHKADTESMRIFMTVTLLLLHYMKIIYVGLYLHIYTHIGDNHLNALQQNARKFPLSKSKVRFNG